MFIFFLVLSAIQSATAFSNSSNSPFKGLGSARSIRISRPDIRSSQPNRPSFQDCFIFPGFVIVQVDSGNKGADAISIRNLNQPSESQKACEAKVWKGEKILASQEQYFLGVLSPLLFTRSADIFGNLGFVWAYDLKTGKQVLATGYDHDKDIFFSTQEQTVSMEFYQSLKTPCSIAETGVKCWAQILKENEIPHHLRMSPPDCQDAFSKLDFHNNPSLRKLNSALQIFARVKISQVGHSKPQFLNSKATCHATP